MTAYEWLLAVALFAIGYAVGKVRESEQERPLVVVQSLRDVLKRRHR